MNKYTGLVAACALALAMPAFGQAQKAPDTKAAAPAAAPAPAAAASTNSQQDKMKAIFGVPRHFYFVAVLGLGYQDGDGSPEGYSIDQSYWARKPLDEIVGWGWYRARRGDQPPPAARERLRRNLGL